MKLPDPVAWLDVEMQQAYTVYELANAEGTGFVPLFTEAQLRKALAQQERDTVDGFAIAHLNGHDQAKRRYATVMRQALNALEAVAGKGKLPNAAIKALEDALK